MSDQYPGAGGLAGDEAAETRVRGPLGDVGESLEDSTTDASPGVSGDGAGEGEGETLPPSPDQV